MGLPATPQLLLQFWEGYEARPAGQPAALGKEAPACPGHWPKGRWGIAGLLALQREIFPESLCFSMKDKQPHSGDYPTHIW